METVKNMAISFIPIHKQHIKQLIDIENNAHLYPWSKASFLSSLQYHYWGEILLFDQQHVGYYLFQNIINEVCLVNIAIIKSHQKQRLGQTLLQRAIHVAKAKQFQQCLLEVRESNLAAINLYKKYLFTNNGIRKNYYSKMNNQRENAILMSRKL